jgi:hypothetical protein
VADRAGAIEVLLGLLREEIRLAVRDEVAPLRAAVEAMAHAGALAPISLDAAAPVLEKSVATLRRLAAAGKLPGAMRVGRSWQINLRQMNGTAGGDEIGELAQVARAR